jgi:hypothetical protein
MSECNKELKKRTEHCFDHSPEAAADADETRGRSDCEIALELFI